MIRLLLFNVLFAVQLIWSADFNESRKQAQETHKLILVNFSGSDWCGPCIRLRKEILESGEFESYAQKKLILVRADFPRQKKNQLSKEQERKNEALADMYNPEGKFPYTVLVDENGKVLKHWDGFPDLSPEQFVSQIKLVDDARQ
ncbi:thioredoxin-like protein [Arcticibacter tournemirensis]|uniref:Thioredoxin family protein n=1 Tax=Arcticibacter tournemirensis TaxID=699437 RepID=A0A5M9HDJ8_9SPHI|nr:thioredoxin family protein [Arcticibacter tournemirensis]KAA8483404.1 thioredoxin family protein [Arcticibacter tournemirensis]TQM50904.1 thioredoxin-like protein [Arcticibacter tournemirensis]